MIHIHDNYFHGTGIETGFPSGRGRLVDARYVSDLSTGGYGSSWDEAAGLFRRIRTGNWPA